MPAGVFWRPQVRQRAFYDPNCRVNKTSFFGLDWQDKCLLQDILLLHSVWKSSKIVSFSIYMSKFHDFFISQFFPFLFYNFCRFFAILFQFCGFWVMRIIQNKSRILEFHVSFWRKKFQKIFQSLLFSVSTVPIGLTFFIGHWKSKLYDCYHEHHYWRWLFLLFRVSPILSVICTFFVFQML